MIKVFTCAPLYAMAIMFTFILGGCALIQDSLVPPPEELDIQIAIGCEKCSAPGIGEVPFTVYFWPVVSNSSGETITGCTWSVAKQWSQDGPSVKSSSCTFFSYKFHEPGDYEVRLASDQGEAATLVVALPKRDEPVGGVGANNQLVSCVQRAPRTLGLGESGIVDVTCTVVGTARLDYIYYRADLGINDCLFSEDDAERIWYYPQPNQSVSARIPIRGVIARACPVTATVKASAGHESATLTLESTVTVVSEQP